MKYCSRCLYPQDHPLNLIIDEQGICSGCRVHEEKDSLDWSKRFIKLMTVCCWSSQSIGNNKPKIHKKVKRTTEFFRLITFL